MPHSAHKEIGKLKIISHPLLERPLCLLVMHGREHTLRTLNFHTHTYTHTRTRTHTHISLLCILGACHNRTKSDSKDHSKSHGKDVECINVARRVTLNVTATNGRMGKERARRLMITKKR